MQYTIMVNKRLQDALRDRVLEVRAMGGTFSAASQPQRSLLKARRVVQGLASYRDFLDMICATSVAVKSIDDVVVDKEPDTRGGTKPRPALLRLEVGYRQLRTSCAVVNASSASRVR